MNVRQRKNIKALAIFAILIGVGFAIYNHSERFHRAKQAVLNSIQNSSSDTEAQSGGDSDVSKPSHSSSEEEGEEKTSALNPSDSRSDDENQSDQAGEEEAKSRNQSKRTQTSDQNDTRSGQERGDQQTDRSSTDSDSPSQEDEKDSKNQSSDEEGFRSIEPSSYSAPVRRRLNRAIRYFERAETHYSRAENDTLSLERRQSENEKARSLYKKTISSLDEIRRNKKNHGKKIEKFFDKATDMYSKCYRRAKMWAAH